MAQFSGATAQSFKELRDETRRAVGREPLGSVYVKHRNHRQPVRAIRDFSPRGVSLCIDDALEPGEPVMIELTRDDQQHTFYAYVAWCQNTQSMGDPGAALASRCVAGLRVVGAGSLGPLIQR